MHIHLNTNFPFGEPKRSYSVLLNWFCQKKMSFLYHLIVVCLTQTSTSVQPILSVPKSSYFWNSKWFYGATTLHNPLTFSSISQLDMRIRRRSDCHIIKSVFFLSACFSTATFCLWGSSAISNKVDSWSSELASHCFNKQLLKSGHEVLL